MLCVNTTNERCGQVADNLCNDAGYTRCGLRCRRPYTSNCLLTHSTNELIEMMRGIDRSNVYNSARFMNDVCYQFLNEEQQDVIKSYLNVNVSVVDLHAIIVGLGFERPSFLKASVHSGHWSTHIQRKKDRANGGGSISLSAYYDTTSESYDPVEISMVIDLSLCSGRITIIPNDLRIDLVLHDRNGYEVENFKKLVRTPMAFEDGIVIMQDGHKDTINDFIINLIKPQLEERKDTFQDLITDSIETRLEE